MGEITGINGVCLGSMSESPGKVTCLSGIDDGDGLFRIDEKADERSFVATRGLDDDELQVCQRSLLLEQFFIALPCVREGVPIVERSDMHIEFIFGNVDSHPDAKRSGCRDGVHPVLQMRTRVDDRTTVLAAVRAGTKGAAAILLCDGILNTKARPICRAPRSRRLFACAQRRRLPGLHYTTITSLWQHTRHRGH